MAARAEVIPGACIVPRLLWKTLKCTEVFLRAWSWTSAGSFFDGKCGGHDLDVALGPETLHPSGHDSDGIPIPSPRHLVDRQEARQRAAGSVAGCTWRWQFRLIQRQVAIGGRA